MVCKTIIRGCKSHRDLIISNEEEKIFARSNFTSGNSKILEDLQNILANTLGFIRKKVCPFNNRASWKLGYGTYDTIKLLKFMYYPNYLIGLERKALFTKRI